MSSRTDIPSFLLLSLLFLWVFLIINLIASQSQESCYGPKHFIFTQPHSRQETAKQEKGGKSPRSPSLPLARNSPQVRVKKHVSSKKDCVDHDSLKLQVIRQRWAHCLNKIRLLLARHKEAEGLQERPGSPLTVSTGGGRISPTEECVPGRILNCEPCTLLCDKQQISLCCKQNLLSCK